VTMGGDDSNDDSSDDDDGWEATNIQAHLPCSPIPSLSISRY
jgi:hypothetical protein